MSAGGIQFLDSCCIHIHVLSAICLFSLSRILKLIKFPLADLVYFRFLLSADTWFQINILSTVSTYQVSTKVVMIPIFISYLIRRCENTHERKSFTVLLFLKITISRKGIATIFLKVQENKWSFVGEPSRLCALGKDQTLVTMAYNTYLNEILKEGLNW